MKESTVILGWKDPEVRYVNLAQQLKQSGLSNAYVAIWWSDYLSAIVHVLLCNCN